LKNLRIKTLEGRYHNSDTLMLHGLFQILTDFVEKEKPFDKIDWDSDIEHQHAKAEIKYLYDWWNNIRPDRVDPLDLVKRPSELFVIDGVLPDGSVKVTMTKGSPEFQKAVKDSLEQERKNYEEDTENMKRLIDVRGFMWT